MTTAEQFKKDYIEFKKAVLLDEDVKLLNSLGEDINRFSKMTDKNELIQLESSLASHGFQLANILGRLIGQFDVEKNIFERKKAPIVEKYKAMGFKTNFLPKVNEELAEDMDRIAMFGGVIEEYKAKLYALNRIHSAIDHRIERLDRNL